MQVAMHHSVQQEQLPEHRVRTAPEHLLRASSLYSPRRGWKGTGVRMFCWVPYPSLKANTRSTFAPFMACTWAAGGAWIGCVTSG